MHDYYGPNDELVKEYLRQVPRVFALDRLGKPHPADTSVRRLHDWHELREVVNYASPGAGPHNCPYLRFLVTVDAADSENESVARQNHLEAYVRAAIEDATLLLAEKGEVSQDFLHFSFLREYDEPYPFCRFSIDDHCAYIATELVVAHLTRVHLLRDMWFWYRAGHWPCGWEGDWPEGRLIVF